MNKNSQEKELVSDTGFGLMLFCSVEPFFPIIDLEFDCRGNIEQQELPHSREGKGSSSVTLVTAGEIKSSFSGVPKAKEQLLKRLLVISKGLKILDPDIDILLRGFIFLPSEARRERKEEDTFPSSNLFDLKLAFLE
jgi:hypothetical protein